MDSRKDEFSLETLNTPTKTTKEPRIRETIDSVLPSQPDYPQFPFLRNIGCFLVLLKALLGSYCVVVWVLFLVFCFFCFTSLGDRNTKKLPQYCTPPEVKLQFSKTAVSGEKSTHFFFDFLIRTR